jgi:hypothetical protein
LPFINLAPLGPVPLKQGELQPADLSLLERSNSPTDLSLFSGHKVALGPEGRLRAARVRNSENNGDDQHREQRSDNHLLHSVAGQHESGPADRDGQSR